MDAIIESLRRYGENAVSNITDSFERLTAKQTLRLIVFVCAYMLLRKYLLTLAAKRQERQLEATISADKAAAAADTRTAKLSPNNLRGASALEHESQTFKYPGIPYDTDEDEDEDKDKDKDKAGNCKGATATGGVVQWGRNATKRQRKALRMLLDAEEKRLKAKIGDDDDADIQEFLEDDNETRKAA